MEQPNDREMACELKATYVSLDEAKRQIRHASKRRTKLYAYKCPFCHFWHTSKRPYSLRPKSQEAS